MAPKTSKMQANSLRSILATLALGIACAASPSSGTSTPVVSDSSSEIPRQYIVEYVKGASAARDLSSQAVKVIKSYDSALFTGAAVEFDTNDDAALYASGAHVARIWPNRRVKLDKPVGGQSFSDDVRATEYSTHRVTGVDKLHKAGVLGKGAKVGVVDTGVWYKHPALGGGFGPGFKVAGGYDFVGDVDIGRDAKQPDDDPISLPNIGHGTHVAGIVAAVSDNFVGVAPNATLYAYKVTGNGEGTDDAALIDAFLRAEKDGVDVITASFGSLCGWSDAAWAVVVSRVVEAGVIVTISAGNTGDDGAFSGVDGGSSPGALTVASVQAAVAPAAPFKLTYTMGGVSSTTVSGYVGDDTFPATVKDFPIVDLTTTDCEPFPAGTPRRTNVVALVSRVAGCNYMKRQQWLAELGIEYALFVNDDRAIVPPGNTYPRGTLGLITAEAGAAIQKALRANATVTADFSYTASEVGVPDATGNRPNYYSGWAATYDLQLKPDVAAPGGNVFSTWSDGAYMVQSGTSMSTPYIAGLAALYVGVFGGRRERGAAVARDFHRRVTASGASLPWTDKTASSAAFVAPPVQMGSGMVDAVRTLYANTTLDETKFHLNDTANFRPTQELSITNHGSEAVTYNFTLEPAAGFEIQDPYMAMWDTWGIKTFDNLVPMQLVPDVELPEAVEVAAGETRKVTVTFRNPETKGWNATVLPLYSGKVQVAGSNGERLAVAYMGVAADLYATKRVAQKGYPRSLSGVTYKDIDADATYHFDARAAAFNWPRLYSVLDWGVRELRWDLFESRWDEGRWAYPPAAADGLVGPVARWTGDPPDAGSGVDLADPAVVKVNTVATPLRYLPRDGIYSRAQSQYAWLGHLANGSLVGPGNYTMRVAASRPLADLSKPEGWEVWRREIRVI